MNRRNCTRKLAEALVDQFGENIEKLVVLLLGDFWHTRDKNGGREAIVQLHRSLRNARQGRAWSFSKSFFDPQVEILFESETTIFPKQT